jgi:pilus assembly protein Flp/PilA
MVLRHIGVRIGTGLFARFARDRKGLTALEYGLLTGLIALLIVGAVSLFGTNASSLFTHIANTI